jgi:hypothetical protein
MLMCEIECDGKLDGIEGSQTPRETVLSDEAGSCREVIFRHTVYFNVSSGDIDRAP